ncbi:MAG: hypothetical protein V3T81_09950, partial [Thermoanaerobaculia bacterium]
ITALAMAGFLLLLWRRSRAAVMVWLPALLYLLAYSSVLRNPYERTFRPLLPHLAIASAVAVVAFSRAAEALAQRRWPRVRLARALMIGVVLIALPPVVADVHAARQGETRLEALEWIEANVPAGASMLREWNMVSPPRRLYRVNENEVALWGVGRSPKQLAKKFDYLVASSATFDFVLQQRQRPGFAERVAFYDELFDGSAFQLAARFEPDLFSFGPEIRIYRSRRQRGPRLAGEPLQLQRHRRLWGNSDRLRAQRATGTGAFLFQRCYDLLAGRVVLRKAGRYRLTAEVEAKEPYPVVLALGRRSRQYEVEGQRKIELTADLPKGQVWWRVQVGRGRVRRRQAWVSGLVLGPVETPADGETGQTAKRAAR